MRAAREVWTLLALACATPTHEPLRDLHPYVLPWRESVREILCRWPSGKALGVALPPDASPAERDAIVAALRAWDRAGLGVSLSLVEAGRAPIEIRLVDGPVERDDGRAGSGRTLADCRVDPETGSAGLARARVEIARRTGADWRGATRPLGQEELAGTALHELGHALGFQGHARRGDVPMVRRAEVLRRLGGRILRGEPIQTPQLRALYAQPPGLVLRQTAVSQWRTRGVDRFAERAQQLGLDGPYARVGDAFARIFWRDEEALEVGLVVANLDETLRDATRILVVTEGRARALLATGGDTPERP